MNTRPLALLLLAALTVGAPSPAWAARPSIDPAQLAQELQSDRQSLREADKRLDEARQAMLDVPLARAGSLLALAKTSFNLAQTLLSARSPQVELANSWMVRGEHYAREGELLLIPSRGAEARGMLIDASALPKTEKGIVTLLDRLHDAHFNLIVPEVIRRGYTIYDSRFTDRDPEFRSAPDVLAILVREAHARGMEVQPWIWTFRVRSPGYGNPILSRLPALAARTEGKESRFLSAASPEAREFIYAMINELTTKYDVDGLLMDYIRYDEEIPEDDISWTAFALQHMARTGDLPRRPVPPNSPLMLEWQLWREQQVNTAVEEISHMLKRRRPKFPVGVAVFRGEAYARLVKMQHWRHWSNNRWVDFASPMLYTARNADLDRWLDWETDHHTRTNLIYPILGVHRFTSKDNLTEELGLLNTENEPGSMIFSLSHFDMSLLDDLREGPYREPATLPHRNLPRAVRKTLARSQNYLQGVFREGDFETAASASMLYQQVQSVAQSLPLHELPYQQNDALIARLGGLEKLASVAPLPQAVRKEFDHRIDYAITLVRANAFELTGTQFVSTSLPPIKVQTVQSKLPRD